MLYTSKNNLKTSFIGGKKIVVNSKNKLEKVETNKGEFSEGNIALDTDYKTFLEVTDYAKNTSSFFSLMDALAYISPSVLVRCKKYENYVECYNSLKNYLKNSLEVLKIDFDFIYNNSWPIYTKTYDTPPCYILQRIKSI